MDIRQIEEEILDPELCAERWFPHDVWTELRSRPSPVWLQPEGFEGFYAIVKHADLKEISTQPDKFINEPRPFLMEKDRHRLASLMPLKMLIQMDPPEHRVYRKLVSGWFVPRNIKKLEDRMRWSARDLIGRMAAAGTWQGDFVSDIAAIHPLRLIQYLFGVPDSDGQFLLDVAYGIFGADDPEFRGGRSDLADLLNLAAEAFPYFGGIFDERRRRPTEDLASAIATARIDGKPIPRDRAIGYYIIILTAGHETTRTAMSGGLHALLENPNELRKLKQRPELVRSAVEEMVRWTSPVSQFSRTATEDYELRGQVIKKGESVGLFYGSANRDEEVFEAPFEFRVDRDPNPHLGFGVGEHFCLGAALARLEMVAFFEEFIPRVDIDSLEVVGEVEYLASNFVAGVKHLPLRCRMETAPSLLGARTG